MFVSPSRTYHVQYRHGGDMVTRRQTPHSHCRLTLGGPHASIGSPVRGPTRHKPLCVRGARDANGTGTPVATGHERQWSGEGHGDFLWSNSPSRLCTHLAVIGHHNWNTRRPSAMAGTAMGRYHPAWRAHVDGTLPPDGWPTSYPVLGVAIQAAGRPGHRHDRLAAH